MNWFWVIFILSILICLFLLVLYIFNTKSIPTCEKIQKRILDDISNRIENVNEIPPQTKQEYIIRFAPVFETFNRAVERHENTPFINMRMYELATDLNQQMLDVFDDFEYGDYWNNVPIPTIHIHEDVLNQPIYNQKTFTSDPQNVHDHSVVEDVKKISSIIDVNKQPTDPDPEILHYILDSNIDPVVKEKAIQTLDTVKNINTNIANLNAREGQVLNAVWNRSKIPENSGNSELIKESLITNLANCVEDNKKTSVCSTGRVNNIVSTLVLLDYDSRTSQIGTSEMYKNEILDECAKVRDKLYETIQDDTQFKLAYEAEINKIQQKYPDHLNNRFKMELLAAI